MLIEDHINRAMSIVRQEVSKQISLHDFSLSDITHSYRWGEFKVMVCVQKDWVFLLQRIQAEPVQHPNPECGFGPVPPIDLTCLPSHEHTITSNDQHTYSRCSKHFSIRLFFARTPLLRPTAYTRVNATSYDVPIDVWAVPHPPRSYKHKVFSELYKRKNNIVEVRWTGKQSHWYTGYSGVWVDLGARKRYCTRIWF